MDSREECGLIITGSGATGAWTCCHEGLGRTGQRGRTPDSWAWIEAPRAGGLGPVHRVVAAGGDSPSLSHEGDPAAGLRRPPATGRPWGAPRTGADGAPFTGSTENGPYLSRGGGSGGILRAASTYQRACIVRTGAGGALSECNPSLLDGPGRASPGAQAAARLPIMGAMAP